MANWTTIFSPPQDCECKDCKNIFSPAAYLVDIMQFLDNCPKNSAGYSPLDILLGCPRYNGDTRAPLAGRRPDIGNLLLTCENTNTRIPYIDLANEIMEYYVVNYHGALPFPGFPPDPDLLHDTGDVQSDELSAEPQYIRIDAYSNIYQNGIYPFNLPYHQPLDIIRSYIEFLQSTRAELMEVFGLYFDSNTNKFVAIPKFAIDAEKLRLSLKEFEILTGADFTGAALAPVSPEAYFGSPAPAFTGTGVPIETLIQRTGLKYTELLEVISTKFINPGQDALNVLQNLLNQASPQPDQKTFYSEIKGGGWTADAGLMKALTDNGISQPTFATWVTNNFLAFQKVITFYEPDSGCNLGKTSLQSVLWVYEQPPTDNNIDSGFLSKLHRFIRLWRKTNWTMHELDNLISAFGDKDITPLLIHKLSMVEKVNDVLQLSLVELACLWGNIDSYGDYSLYAQLFLKKTGTTRTGAKTEQSIFLPGPLNEILTPNTQLFKDNLPEVFAALGISADDYNLIITDVPINPGTGTLSLQNLSSIYRYKLLADALNLSVSDFCLLKSCLGINPFTTIDNTWIFIQQTQKLESLSKSSFSIPVLNYVLNGVAKDVDNIALAEDKALEIFPGLRNKLLGIEKGNLDPLSKATAEQTQIISAVAPLIGLDTPTASAFVSPDFPSLMPSAINTGLTGSYFMDEKFLAPGPVQRDAKIDFIWPKTSPNPSGTPGGKFSVRWKGWISPPADGVYTFTVDIKESDETAALWIDTKRIFSINRADFTDTLAGITGQATISLSGGKMYPVIIEYAQVSGDAGIQFSWQTTSTTKSNVDPSYLFPAADFQPLVKRLTLYHQVAKAIGVFEITADEVNYMIANFKDFNNINFLPLNITQWFRLADYNEARKNIPGKLLLSIFQLAAAEDQAALGAAPSKNLLTTIVNSSISTWTVDSLTFINTFNSYTVKNFRNETNLIQIKKIFDLAVKTKMPVDTNGLPYWTVIETDPTDPVKGGFDYLHKIADQIKNAVKAKNRDHWLTIGKQLNDSVRENQKQGLIAYLLTLNLLLPLPPGGVSVDDADKLYEYLLIDVQTSTAVDTSRLIQATLAVQAFADRCLLGMEKDVPVKSISPSEWNWLKHYSVAAGLKKLFVYVENYLHPSLRDDKSQFFVDFESSLKKNDITDQNVENAFRDYLYKLSEVSNVEVCGMWHDRDTETIHVFARSHAAPYSYYYRKATNNSDTQNSWSWFPWEKVELDIKSIDDGDKSGVHLMPVVWNKRLILFWPEFMHKSVSRKSGSNNFHAIADSSSPDGTGPQEFWDIRLCWSEYAKDKWTPKKMSKEKLSPLYYSGAEKDNITLRLIDPKDFFWNARIDNGTSQLTITLYLRSVLLQNTFKTDQIAIGNFLFTGIQDPITTSYDSSTATSIAKYDITFNKFDFINSENLVKNHVALYVYFSDQATTYPRTLIWCWNNDGDKTDENNNIPLTDAAGNPTFATIGAPAGVCTFTVEAYTRDHDSWPSADNFENNLTTSSNTLQVDFSAPPTGIQKIGPSIDDENHHGVSIYFTITPAGYELAGNLDTIQTISNLDSGIYASDTYKDLEPFYETFGQQNELIINAKAILENVIDYRILFSNNVAVKNFESRFNFPFFYYDNDNHKNFFVTPFLNMTKIITSILNPTKAVLNIIDEELLNPRVNSIDEKPTQVEISNPYKRILTQQKVSEQQPEWIDRTSSEPAMTMYSLRTSGNSGYAVTEYNNQYTTVERETPSFFGGFEFNPFARQNNGFIGFYTFYHPFVSYFIKKLNEKGVEGLMTSDTAEFPNDQNFPYVNRQPDIYANDQGVNFTVDYAPDFTYVKKYDPNDKQRNYYLENVDFSDFGTYSCYNWELFFHAPMLIATTLSKNGKYLEARKWFHYIFNPLSIEPQISGNPNSPFWQVLPFKNLILDDIISYISNLPAGYDNSGQIDQWRADPLNPFLIARGRQIAFMKNVVMCYLENLIHWADDLFIAYTRENINEAVLLYVSAAQILGPQPQYVPARGTLAEKSFNDLYATLDDFGDAYVQLQNTFPNSSSVQIIDTTVPQNLMGIGRALYFCIPPNDNLLQYWTTVADRLFKIRHGENIDGIAVPLPLYEPPIDPELLLLAKSQGLDIAGILADLESPEPIYRYNYLLQKATDFCTEVVSLGSSLLSASEKSDAEQLARIRQTQEIDLLNQVTHVKTRQVLEAQANLDTLNTERASAIQRLSYYAESLLGNSPSTIPDPKTLNDDLNENSSLPPETIIAKINSSIDVSLSGTSENGVKVIPKENLEMNLNEAAQYTQLAGNAIETLSSIFHLLPDFDIMTSPFGVGTKVKVTGGQQLGDSFGAAARGILGVGNFLSAQAASASRMAGFIRREQEWVFQANNTIREIIHLDKQITAAQIRLQLSSHELENHRQQISNAEDVKQFYESKFTRQELYDWMIDKLRQTYKIAYQLAYNMALKAEKAYRLEIGVQDTSFVQYGYFNDSYLGITAGEQLLLALKQMDSAFIENNKREYELTKHFSLLQIEPLALIKLKENQTCTFTLPEELFDMDYPGHYCRKIKSVSITLPCIAGPYTTVNSTLRLISSSIRISTDTTSSPYAHNSSGGSFTADNRFVENKIPFTAIATSNAQNDSGLFELIYRDERYLPFEGSGVISSWQFDLSKSIQQFDYDTISDVVLHIKYSSREGDQIFKTASETNINARINQMGVSTNDKGLMRYFSARHDFPNEWYQFMHPIAGQDQVLSLNMATERFPFFAQKISGKKLSITAVDVFADVPSPFNPINKLVLDAPLSNKNLPALSVDPNFGNLLRLAVDYSAATELTGIWQLSNPKSNAAFAMGTINDIIFVVHYQLV